jgi:hypothetical protein
MQFSPTTDEVALVKRFQNTWANFARGNIPLSWKGYDRDKDNYVIFDIAMSQSDGLHTPLCDYWDTLSPP